LQNFGGDFVKLMMVEIEKQFTPLESPSIYAGDGGNRKHQLLIEGGVKPLPFLTGLTERGRQENVEDPLVIFHLFNPVGRGDR